MHSNISPKKRNQRCRRQQLVLLACDNKSLLLPPALSSVVDVGPLGVMDAIIWVPIKHASKGIQGQDISSGCNHFET